MLPGRNGITSFNAFGPPVEQAMATSFFLFLWLTDEFRFVVGSIWNTCARVLKIGCSLQQGQKLCRSLMPPRGKARPEWVSAHLAVDIGQVGLDGL